MTQLTEERKHGYWTEESYWRSRGRGKSIRYYTYRCSVCSTDVSRRHKYEFCPRCGAIMDLNKENTNETT